MRVNLLGLALVLVALSACTEGGGTEGPSLNSNTNWLLACSGDGDCPDALSCLCGQCTEECVAPSDCSIEGAECVVNAVSCASAPLSACLPGCADDAECGDGYECVPSGRPADDPVSVCVPEWADAVSTGCINGLQFHCGATIGAATNVLFECASGTYTRVETCEGACISTGETEAFCTPDCGDGGPPTCGNDENGGDPDSLYACRAGRLSWISDCPYGCGGGDGPQGCAPAP